MNDTSSKCPKCGGTVEIATAQGLCPKCLLAAVALPTETGATSQSAMVLPTLPEVAAAFPHLEIVEVIGQGGMGIVFKARQPKLDRLVALKILPLMLAADPAFAERFTREGRVLARLNHPNIVTVHDFGQAGGFFYLLMEFVDGANLRQAMQAGRFTPEQALAVVPKVCEALQYAHNEGILHRDIKPENILLDAKGRVKIADFGIAKLVGEPVAEKNLTGSGARLGTPHYMAPEQVERPSEVDHRADIYSLGVVFYEMLTGELPLGRFAAPSEKSQSDPRLDEVVFSTLQKEPSRRTQSAAEVKTQVENITGTVAMGEAPRTSAPPGGNLPMSKASACYLTTPEHLASMAGQWNLYRARGGLKLDGTNLAFVHDWHGVTIPLRAIRDLSIGHYPWVMKPTRLDFICVTFEENGTLRRLLFTPHESRWMPTWETNEVVAEWFTAIREAVVRVTGRAPTSTPAAQLQIPEPKGWQRAAFAALVMVPFVLFLCVGSLALLRGDGALNPRMFIPLALVAGFAGAIVWIWSRQRRHGKAAAGGQHSPGGASLLLTVMGIGIALGLIFLISIRPAPRTPPPPPVVSEVPPRAQAAAPNDSGKIIELYNPKADSHSLISLESISRMEPGESLTTAEKHPDGRTTDGYTSYTRTRDAGNYDSGYLFIWHLPPSFKPELCEDAVAQLKAVSKRPLTFAAGTPITLFSVTNEFGGVFQGTLRFQRLVREAKSSGPVQGSVRLTTQPQPFGMVMHFYDTLIVPSGFELSPVGGIFPAQDGYSQIGLDQFRGSGFMAWRPPRNFGTNEISAAYEQLSALSQSGPVLVSQNEPRTVFSITNASGDIYRGYLKLFERP